MVEYRLKVLTSISSIWGGSRRSLSSAESLWHFLRPHSRVEETWVKNPQIIIISISRSFSSPPPSFFRQLRFQEFDIAELSLSSYTLTLNQENPPFIALPIFPSRFFRHQSIYVSKRANIKKPSDLRGKRAGCPEWQVRFFSNVQVFFFFLAADIFRCIWEDDGACLAARDNGRALWPAPVEHAVVHGCGWTLCHRTQGENQAWFAIKSECDADWTRQMPFSGKTLAPLVHRGLLMIMYYPRCLLMARSTSCSLRALWLPHDLWTNLVDR